MYFEILLYTFLVAFFVGGGLFTGLALSIKLGLLPKLEKSKNDDSWFCWLCKKPE